MHWRLTTIILIAYASLATNAQDFTPVDNIETDSIQTVVDRLGAAGWKEREEAHRILIEMGDKDPDFAIGQMLPAYMQHEDPEVRYRLRVILKTLVDAHLFREKKGFLGVSLQQSLAPIKIDGEEVHPIRIHHVLPDHAAIRHGVRINEKILRVDARYCNKDSFPLEAVISYIKTRGPGTKVTLKLLSADKSIRDVGIPLGERPAASTDPPIEQQKKLFFKHWLIERISALTPEVNEK